MYTIKAGTNQISSYINTNNSQKKSGEPQNKINASSQQEDLKELANLANNDTCNNLSNESNEAQNRTNDTTLQKKLKEFDDTANNNTFNNLPNESDKTQNVINTSTQQEDLTKFTNLTNLNTDSFKLHIGRGGNNESDYYVLLDEIRQIFGGNIAGASTLCDNLDAMSNSTNSIIKNFADTLINAFENYGISDSQYLKDYVIQEMISKINQQCGGDTFKGVGDYVLNSRTLAKLLHYNNLDKVQNILNDDELLNNGFDSTIGDFVQVGGSCWLCSGLKALSASTTGQELLRDSMSWADDKSSVTITFKGVKKSYNISIQDILAKRTAYAYGDIEAVAYAMATEMVHYDMDHGGLQFYFIDENGNETTSAEVPYWVDITHTTDEGYEDYENPGDGLHGGRTEQFFFFLTGKIENSHGNDKTNAVLTLDNEKQKRTYLEHLLEDGLNNYSAVVTLGGEKLYKFYKYYNDSVFHLTNDELEELKNGGHALAITGITENTVTISDPASITPVTMDWNMFIKYFSTVIELYMPDKTVSNQQDNDTSENDIAKFKNNNIIDDIELKTGSNEINLFNRKKTLQQNLLNNISDKNSNKSQIWINNKEYQKIARQISEYATKGPNEFIEEYENCVLKDNEVSNEATVLYRKLNNSMLL